VSGAKGEGLGSETWLDGGVGDRYANICADMRRQWGGLGGGFGRPGGSVGKKGAV